MYPPQYNLPPINPAAFGGLPQQGPQGGPPMSPPQQCWGATGPTAYGYEQVFDQQGHGDQAPHGQ